MLNMNLNNLTALSKFFMSHLLGKNLKRQNCLLSYSQVSSSDEQAIRSLYYLCCSSPRLGLPEGQFWETAVAETDGSGLVACNSQAGVIHWSQHRVTISQAWKKHWEGIVFPLHMYQRPNSALTEVNEKNIYDIIGKGPGIYVIWRKFWISWSGK